MLLREAWSLLMPLLCVRLSVQKGHRHVQIVDMSDERTGQSMRTTSFLLILSEVCSGIGMLGLVLSLAFAQERKDNRPQHLIHVRLTDQVSLFTTRSVVQGFKPEGSWRTLMHENPCLHRKLIFCEKWREDQPTLTLIYLAAMGATDSDKVS